MNLQLDHLRHLSATIDLQDINPAFPGQTGRT
jgi:hypothetical protein